MLGARKEMVGIAALSELERQMCPEPATQAMLRKDWVYIEDLRIVVGHARAVPEDLQDVHAPETSRAAWAEERFWERWCHRIIFP
jgi:hypothetical protein